MYRTVAEDVEKMANGIQEMIVQQRKRRSRTQSTNHLVATRLAAANRKMLKYMCK